MSFQEIKAIFRPVSVFGSGLIVYLQRENPLKQNTWQAMYSIVISG